MAENKNCKCETPEFTLILNQQGPQGLTGERGPAGFSPQITVRQEDEAHYVLDITTSEGTITTPNLKANLPTVGGIGSVLTKTGTEATDIAWKSLVTPSTGEGLIKLNPTDLEIDDKGLLAFISKDVTADNPDPEASTGVKSTIMTGKMYFNPIPEVSIADGNVTGTVKPEIVVSREFHNELYDGSTLDKNSLLHYNLNEMVQFASLEAGQDIKIERIKGQWLDTVKISSTVDFTEEEAKLQAEIDKKLDKDEFSAIQQTLEQEIEKKLDSSLAEQTYALKTDVSDLSSKVNTNTTDIAQLKEDVQDVVTDLGTKANATELESLQTEVSELQTSVQANTTEIANVNGDLANETAEREETDTKLQEALDNKQDKLTLLTPLKLDVVKDTLNYNATYINGTVTRTAGSNFTSNSIDKVDTTKYSVVSYPINYNDLVIASTQPAEDYVGLILGTKSTDSEKPMYITLGYFKEIEGVNYFIGVLSSSINLGTSSTTAQTIKMFKLNDDNTVSLMHEWQGSSRYGDAVSIRFLKSLSTSGTMRIMMWSTEGYYSLGDELWNIPLTDEMITEIKKITHVAYVPARTTTTDYTLLRKYVYNGKQTVFTYRGGSEESITQYLQLDYDNNTLKVNEQGQLYADVQSGGTGDVTHEEFEALEQRVTDLETAIDGGNAESPMGQAVMIVNLENGIQDNPLPITETIEIKDGGNE